MAEKAQKPAPGQGRAVRNVAILAHVDHGKSTLADRLIELCGALGRRDMREQVLDSMEIERERGITIKSQTVRLDWRDAGGKAWVINIVDTPGHVDFSYEVSRALAACEGALLLVDASQGVQAQTLAHVWTALEYGREVIAVLNKVDLASADAAMVRRQLEDMVGLDGAQALEISARTGFGVTSVLAAVVERLPPPHEGRGKPLRALVIDSWYDSYLGVTALLRVHDGALRRGMKVRLLAAGTRCVVEKVGVFTPHRLEVAGLEAGDIGFMTAGVKSASAFSVGDTLAMEREEVSALAGFRAPLRSVFCGLFPFDSDEYPSLRDALDKLVLNDASLSHEPESSPALGHGFRCGFLGLLHLDVTVERLRREFGLELIVTTPSVVYRVRDRQGVACELRNPAAWPDSSGASVMEEPWVRASIFVEGRYIGAVLELMAARRGVQKELTWSGERASMLCELPLNEIVYDFHDKLKSATRGSASLHYEPCGYRQAEVVKVVLRVNEEPVDALAFVAHRDSVQRRARRLCERLKAVLPRQLFKVPIQAVAGGRVIARETVPALRKDVTAKCYGGDVSRKRKLLEKQKAGKKRMKRFGRVSVPQSAFAALLRADDS